MYGNIKTVQMESAIGHHLPPNPHIFINTMAVNFSNVAQEACKKFIENDK